MKVLADNKKAFFEYEITDRLEAGVILTGQEVKSIKSGNINLKGSYVVAKQGEIYLIGCHIPPYQPKNVEDYLPERSRKLLLKRKEVDRLIGISKEKGLTLIPLKVYTRRGLVKIEVGIARGKKRFDKRESIKRRDIDRDLRRSLKN